MFYLLYCKKKCPQQKSIGKLVVTYGSLYMVADRQKDVKVLHLRWKGLAFNSAVNSDLILLMKNEI
jgi:hypothetical protein